MNKCNMDCFNCVFEDCINDDFTKDELEIKDETEKIGKISIKCLDNKTKIIGKQGKNQNKAEYFKEYYKLYCDIIIHNQMVDYDKEKNTANHRRYVEKNKDKVKEYQKSYYQRNKERLKAKSKENYLKKKEMLANG